MMQRGSVPSATRPTPSTVQTRDSLHTLDIDFKPDNSHGKRQCCRTVAPILPERLQGGGRFLIRKPKRDLPIPTSTQFTFTFFCSPPQILTLSIFPLPSYAPSSSNHPSIYPLEMYSASALCLHLLALLLSTTCRALLLPAGNISTHPSEAVVQQSLELAPPVPILDIGYVHMLNQDAANATHPKDNIPAGHHIQSDIVAPALVAASGPTIVGLCNATSPCVDGSCCNSVGSPNMRVEMVLIEHRQVSADLLRIIVIPLLLRHASRTVMLMLCVELILCMVSRSVPWDFAVRIWDTAVYVCVSQW